MCLNIQYHCLFLLSLYLEIARVLKWKKKSTLQKPNKSNLTCLPFTIQDWKLLISVCTDYEFKLSSQTKNDLLKHSKRELRLRAFICIHKQGMQSKMHEQCYLAFRKVLRRSCLTAACLEVTWFCAGEFILSDSHHAMTFKYYLHNRDPAGKKNSLLLYTLLYVALYYRLCTI